MGTRRDSLTDEEIRALPVLKVAKGKGRPLQDIALPKEHADHDPAFCWCWISEWTK